MNQKEGKPLYLTPRDRENQLAEKIPVSLLWLHATDPSLITPYKWENGGMAHIIFRTPDGTPVVNIYRTVSHNANGSAGIQDEVHPSHENEGAKFNYQVDHSGAIVEYSDTSTFSEQMQGCVNLITPLVSQPGSSIMVIRGGGGVESRFESDGTQWINERQKSKLSSPSLPPTK